MHRPSGALPYSSERPRALWFFRRRPGVRRSHNARHTTSHQTPTIPHPTYPSPSVPEKPPSLLTLTPECSRHDDTATASPEKETTSWPVYSKTSSSADRNTRRRHFAQWITDVRTRLPPLGCGLERRRNKRRKTECGEDKCTKEGQRESQREELDESLRSTDHHGIIRTVEIHVHYDTIT